MRPVLPMLSLFVLCACTPMQWVRDGAPPPTDQLERDAAVCRQEAWREAQYRAWAYRPAAPFVWRDPFGRRFAPWPYSPYPYPFGDPFFEEARLHDFCMRAKGYELVPVPRKSPG